MPDPSAPPPDIDEASVRLALETVTASRPFRDSPQLRAFLSFVVEEVLSGRGDEIKGYTIATQALGRPADFDPQVDPIVRVQAGRVRQALAEFESEHPDLPILIRLEKGTYAPSFTRRSTPVVEAASNAPQPLTALAASVAGHNVAEAKLAKLKSAGVARKWPTAGLIAACLAGLLAVGFAFIVARSTVLPSRDSAAGQMPAAPARQPTVNSSSFLPVLVAETDPTSSDPGIPAMTARLREALARFDDIIGVAETGGSGAATLPQQPTRRLPGRDLMLRVTGHPATSGEVRLSMRLLDRSDNRLIWSREYDPYPAGSSGDGARLAIIRSASSILAQPYGVIHAHIRARTEGSLQSNDPYGCMVTSFDYWQTNDEATHAAARTCIMARLKDHGTNGGLHAQLAYLHLEEFRHGYNPLPGDPLARALDSAQAAVRFAPASARSHQALLAALFSRRDMEGAWRAANEALALNPYDTDIMADVAARHIQAGRYEQGLLLMSEAFELNPAPPVWARTYQAIALYLLNRLEEASIIAAQLESTRYPSAMVATVLVAYQRRDAPKARERLTLLRQTHPAIASDLAGYLDRLNVSKLLMDRALASYSAAVTWTDAQP